MRYRVLSLVVTESHLDRSRLSDIGRERSMRGLLAATMAALMTLALAACSDSDESVEVTGMGGEPYESIPGEDVGEVFSDGPCADWQDLEGTIIRYTFAAGEDSGVPWVSDERVAGDYE